MHYRRYPAVLALLIIATATVAHAEPSCTPTVRVATKNYPGADAIPPSNNLLLPEGKSVTVEGQQLILRGRVLDSRCLPVREAIVELWQTDPFGKWYLAEGEDLVNPYPVFAGAGRAVTDANGQFTFITAFPGPTSQKASKNTVIVHAPQVNLRIKAQGFPDFTTSLFFENDRRNAGDPVYSKLPVATRASTTLNMQATGDKELTGSIDLVLKGKAPYQTY